MSFGNKVQKLRKNKRISQEELAKLVEVSPNHLSKIENNKLIPYADTIKKISHILDVSIDYLLLDDAPQNTNINKLNDAELVDLVFQMDGLSEEDKDTAKKLIKALITKSKVETLLQ